MLSKMQDFVSTAPTSLYETLRIWRIRTTLLFRFQQPHLQIQLPMPHRTRATLSRQGSYDYSEVTRAFSLPSLVKLDVRFVVPDENAEDFFENSAGKIGTSKVKELTLHGALDPQDYKTLSTLLSIPFQLESLTLYSSRNAFSAKAVLEGLAHSRESLRDLTLLGAFH